MRFCCKPRLPSWPPPAHTLLSHSGPRRQAQVPEAPGAGAVRASKAPKLDWGEKGGPSITRMLRPAAVPARHCSAAARAQLALARVLVSCSPASGQLPGSFRAAPATMRWRSDAEAQLQAQGAVDEEERHDARAQVRVLREQRHT